MNIRLTDIDSVIPNLALMKLAHYYISRGDNVFYKTSLLRDLFEPNYDIVYGSSVFSFSREKQDIFLVNFPTAIIGGTGFENNRTVEEITGQYEHYDYSIYPDYKWSIGYTQRGCRFNCHFCVVPHKEGKNHSTHSIYDIWRGEGYEKKIFLIDNDFFGQEKWEERCQEIIDGKFLVSLSQGINLRCITDKQIEYLSEMDLRDIKFKGRAIYTAWDNAKDEKLFFNGVKRIREFGIKTTLICYVLLGFKSETDEEIEYRVKKLVNEKNILVYPMIFNNKLNQDYDRLRLFRNWILTRAAYKISFSQFMAQGGDTVKD